MITPPPTPSSPESSPPTTPIAPLEIERATCLPLGDAARVWNRLVGHRGIARDDTTVFGSS